MARTDPQFNLRIPQELKTQIEQSAKKNNRSINAEAVYLLQLGLKPPTQTIAPTSIEQDIQQILAEIQTLKGTSS